MISKNFYEELEGIALEKQLNIDDVKQAVVTGLIKGCQFEGHKGLITVEFLEDQKKIRIFETFTIVEEVDPEGIEGQITLEEAKDLRSRVKIGQEIRKEINFSSIGRKGATRFKSIFIQGLKELGNKRAFEFFKEKEGEMINATVVKANSNLVLINLGLNVNTVLPSEEAIPGEVYVPGNSLRVCITKVEETGKGPKVYVTRNNKDLIKRLFEMYIPEVASGVVEVMAISREPGSRTKIGVMSTNPSVDAKGACVGLKGARITSINKALNGEKVDIFLWSEDPVQLIAEALTPAKIIAVLPDEETRKSIVIVPDNEFSLAIGRGGQNARLASQAIGWKIDIKDETQAYRDNIRFKPNVNK